MPLHKQVTTLCCAACVLTLALAGCSRGDNAQVQVVPKEDAAAPVPAPVPVTSAPSQPDFHAQMTADAPEQVKWTLPAGWEEKAPSQMRVGSFTAEGKDGQTADISIIPLPDGGREVDLVNMWRQQMQLRPVGADAADQGTETVVVGSDPGKLFEFTGEGALENNQAQRMLVAMITRGNTSWFFKMKGEKSFMAEQKPVFLDFLKSVTFQAPAPAIASADNPHAFMSANSMPAPAAAPAGNSDKPATWTVPAGWKELPATEFLVAKYEIAGGGGAKADVNVSAMGGTGGGLLPNINRWRGQLGLAAIDDSDLASQSSSIDVTGGKATLVDLSGTDKAGQKSRLVGVILPQPGATWFYKLMGDEQIVGQQKDAFVQFIQSAKYSNAQ